MAVKHLPYEVYIDQHAHRLAAAWCEERWGKRWGAIENRQGIWSCFWAGHRGPNAGKYRYLFENEKDATMFILRWS
jgi:hypothetical protein